MLILFDESGTPTFDAGRELKHFVGVAVSYSNDMENDIFEECDSPFGLSNKNPIKNPSIDSKRAMSITEQILKLPMRLSIHSVNLDDSALEEKLALYIEWGNLLREFHRKIRPRPLPQFLHSQVLDGCLFDAILRPVEEGIREYNFSIFIDNWAIPINDQEPYLIDRSPSIQDKINNFLGEYFPGISIEISPLSLLEIDSKRKRFIDVITSVVSRAFLREDHIRHSTVPLEMILASGIGTHKEDSEEIKSFVTELMDSGSRNPPKSPY